jgi:hypothetical protein
MLLSLNLRRIAYYIPYSRQVLPKHRKIVRMNPKLNAEEDSQWKIFLSTWIIPWEQNDTLNMKGLQEQNGNHRNRMVSMGTEMVS